MRIEEVIDSPVAVSQLVGEGDAAFVDEDYEAAISKYTKALEVGRRDAAVLCKRAAAHIKLENYTDAVADSNSAVSANPSYSMAYLRKGIACFHLEEYEAALASFKAGASRDPSNSNFGKWIRKCEAELAEEEGTSTSAATTRSSLRPVPTASMDVDTSAAAASTPATATATVSASSPRPAPAPATEQTSSPTTPAAAAAAVRAEVQPAQPQPQQPLTASPPAPKYRHEWYQTASQVTVTVFAKGLKAEQLTVQMGEQVLSVVITDPDPSLPPYVLTLRLFGRITPSQSRHSLLSTKVEIKLAKAETIHWTGLEASARTSVVQPVNVSDERAQELLHSYPSSSRKSHVDWDKLEADVKAEEKDEKLEGDAALNKLFQDIYKGADEDTRRAMNKSFVESGGTVLSTNWKDVGTKKVESKQ